jgi:hypothetical protein
MRQCGGCTLCCKLIPVEELHKAGGQRCTHQRTGKGCAIYARRPVSCREWNCLWLIGTHGGAPLPLGRPDRTHYVLDEVPDLIRIRDNRTGEIVDQWEVMQIWVDPLYPDAWKDPALLAMLDQGAIVALVRYSSTKGFTLFPPSRMVDHQWHQEGGETVADEAEFWTARRAARLAFWRRQQGFFEGATSPD